jgi:hypothetical protein
MYQIPDRPHAMRDRYAEEPRDPAADVSLVDVAEARNDAERKSDQRTRIEVASNRAGRFERVAAFLAEARTLDDDRLPALGAESRLAKKIGVRHGR